MSEHGGRSNETDATGIVYIDAPLPATVLTLAYRMHAERERRETCQHAECCRYFLCAHPKCCGYAVMVYSSGATS